MIKYLSSCVEFITTLEESLERTDIQVMIFNDMVGNLGFNVVEGDVVHTYYSPDKQLLDLDTYIDFANRLRQIVRAETEKKILGDLT
jgi:hypothetical protein